MDANPEPKRARMGEAAMGLVMAAGMSRRLERIRVDIDSIGKRSTESNDVLAAFIERHTGAAGAVRSDEAELGVVPHRRS